MRAFAVIMMIQGHTIDTFLADEFRDMNSVVYFTWRAMRGFTAPIFMFTAGLIFTYLLRIDDYEISNNPRIIKGIKRGFILIGIGYLLRYPTYRIFDFRYVVESQWKIFFAVDALHLIGFGLFAIIIISIISKTYKINFYILISALIILLFISSPYINMFNWNTVIPQYISAYFTKQNGSLFPLFPWLIYVLFGSVLGNILYNNNSIYLRKRFSVILILIGLGSIATSFIINIFEDSFVNDLLFWVSSSSILFLRIGYVIIISGIIAFIVRKINSVPLIIIESGRNTLLLYVIHIILLYGCAWFPGLYKYYGKSFTPFETSIATIIMLGLMLAVVKVITKLKKIKKQKFIFE